MILQELDDNSTYYGIKILDSDTGYYTILLYVDESDAVLDYGSISELDSVASLEDMLKIVNEDIQLSDIRSQGIIRVDSNTYMVSNYEERYLVEFVGKSINTIIGRYLD